MTCTRLARKTWLAGSVTKEEMSGLWKIGVHVICVRGAACSEAGNQERFGRAPQVVVADLAGISS